MSMRVFRPVAVIAAAMILTGAVVVFVNASPSSPGIEQDRQRLAQISEELAPMQEAYRAVLRVVEPSVVHITTRARAPRMELDGFGGPGSPEELEEFFRHFFEDRGRPFPEPFRPRPGPEEERDRQDDDRDFRRYDMPQPIGQGSGWVYDTEGHIVTNYHVVRRAEEIEVLFADRHVATAELVGYDERTDIAVLKVDRDPEDLVPAKLTEDAVERGDIVFAFGSPLRFRFSVSQGIISGTGRTVGLLGIGGYEDFLQTDAAINPGNSGGPLTNLRGEVVGMNTAIATRTGVFAGIGLAIPADMLRPVVRDLLEKGEVRRGYLGAYIGDDPRLLESFGVERGVYIDDLLPDSPAGDAGLEPGDVITHVDDAAMESAEQLRRVIAGYRPGEQVELTIVRAGEQKRLTVELGALPDPEQTAQRGLRPGPDRQQQHRERQRMEMLGKLGIEAVRNISAEEAGRADLPEVDGVLIERIRRNSVAHSAGLAPNTIVTHVANQRVHNVDEFIAALRQVDALRQGVRLTARVSPDRSTFVFLIPPERE